VLYAFYFVLMFVYPAGMGFGDVKLAGVLGLYLGWVGWGAVLVGAFGAFLLGGVVSVALIATGRATRKSGIPFGPFMLAGAGLGIAAGESVWSWYLAMLT
jgi:leader peptidase (prepilin peptidase)/N-methyltransferase